MNGYDEEEQPPAPELEDAPIGQEKTVTIKLTVSPAAIVRAAVERAMNSNDTIHEQIEKAVRKAINERVSTLVETFVRDQCAELVEHAVEMGLKNGFPIYDGYGRRTEKTTETLEQQVRKALDSDRNLAKYGEPKLNLIDHTLNQLLVKELKPVIDAEVKQLAASAREQVRTKFATALAETLAR